LPQEPYLWVITLGNHEIDYDYDAAMLRATGQNEIETKKPNRMVSEEFGLKELTNFNQDLL